MTTKTDTLEIPAALVRTGSPEEVARIDAARAKRAKDQAAATALLATPAMNPASVIFATGPSKAQQRKDAAAALIAAPGTVVKLAPATGATRKPAKAPPKAPAKVVPLKPAAKAPPKPAKAPAKPAKVPTASGAPARARASTVAAYEAAAKGKLPSPPDFSAETHKRFRPRLAELVALAKAGDVKGLKAVEINPISTSPKALDRYRNLCVTALEAKRVTAK